jgi:hypothetical protein
VSAHDLARESSLPCLWLFNLDAELELAQSGSYQTRAHIARALAPFAAQAHGLMSQGDAVLTPELSKFQKPAIGRAWCPTPSARERLVKAGATPEPAPSIEVLRRVNHRAFSLSLGGGAPGARYVQNADELESVLGLVRAGPWLFKRPLSFAGRGLRRIGREPSDADRRWLREGLARGGLLAEPWLELTTELCVHGWIEQAGRIRLGHVCVQQINQHRAWLSTLRAPDDLDQGHARALFSRAESVADALFCAGYFGPFGIDAYLWRSAHGELELNALSELNARYTMGFSVGFGAAPRPVA